jgi:3-(3-hydroxy-phenyl)propionate hydroxylase
VSPFGARGANSGVQDAENLAWKLAMVLSGRAGEALLRSYGAEREPAADENLRHSTRATDFITPKSDISRLFRDAVLQLAKAHPFARTLVNSGRLSVPATLHGSPLNTPDSDDFDARTAPGACACDAPVRLADGSRGWLLRQLGGDGFTALLCRGPGSDALAAELRAADERIGALAVCTVAGPDGADAGDLVDTDGLVAQRYDLQPGSLVLLRPDQHVCARWRRPSADAVRRAVARALASS